jgi:hypothetical protein
MAYDQDKDPAYKLMQYVTGVMMYAVLLLWAYIAFVAMFQLPSSPTYRHHKQKYGPEHPVVKKHNDCKWRIEVAGVSSMAILACYLGIFILYYRADRRTHPHHRLGS